LPPQERGYREEKIGLDVSDWPTGKKLSYNILDARSRCHTIGRDNGNEAPGEKRRVVGVKMPNVTNQRRLMQSYINTF